MGNGTVRTKISSSWDDSHKQKCFTGTIRTNGEKKWNKKFLIENFKLQYIVNILIFIALLQIKLFSIFQIRKLFCLIVFKIYWYDSPKFPNFQKSGRTSLKMIVDGWSFHLDCWVDDNFVAGLLEENYLSLSLSLCLSLSFCLSLSLVYEVCTYMFQNRN